MATGMLGARPLQPMTSKLLWYVGGGFRYRCRYAYSRPTCRTGYAYNSAKGDNGLTIDCVRCALKIGRWHCFTLMPYRVIPRANGLNCPFQGTAVRLKREQIQLVVDSDAAGTGIAARKGLLQGHLFEKRD